jgi:hypothetical protein
MAKVGTFSNARHLAPYYLFLFPSFLVVTGFAQVVRRPRWQRLGLEIMVFTAIVVAAAGNRPLLPVPAVWNLLHEKFPGNELVADQYSRYADSDFQAARVRKKFLDDSLPQDESVVGYCPVICDGDEPGLWLPYGRRRVECITPDDSPEYVRSLGIHYVVVHLPPPAGGISKWMDKYHAVLAGQCAFSASSAPTGLPLELYLVRLN